MARVKFESSPAMRSAGALIERKRKYLWQELELGESFPVSHSEIKLGSLVTLAFRTGKRLGKKFRVLDHGPEQGYEVGCVAIGLPIKGKVNFGLDEK